jgi:hypothetical protein
MMHMACHTHRELSVNRVWNLRENFGTSKMNPELEPPEKFSEPPKSVTNTPTFIHTQVVQ